MYLCVKRTRKPARSKSIQEEIHTFIATVDNWQNANEIGSFINRFHFFGNPVSAGYAFGRTVYKYSAEPILPDSLMTMRKKAQLLESTEPEECSDRSKSFSPFCPMLEACPLTFGIVSENTSTDF